MPIRSLKHYAYQKYHNLGDVYKKLNLLTGGLGDDDPRYAVDRYLVADNSLDTKPLNKAKLRKGSNYYYWRIRKAEYES